MRGSTKEPVLILGRHSLALVAAATATGRKIP